MLRRLWVLVALGALCACPGTLQHPERFTDGGTDGGGPMGCTINVETAIFGMQCGLAGCHDATSKQNGLDLQSAGVGMRIATGTSSTACGSEPLITLIADKIRPMPSCGAQMPSPALPLTADEIACVDAYLAGLADAGSPADAGQGDGGTP